MKQHRYILMLFAVLLLLLLSGCNADHTITGMWKDINEEYYVQISDDGTYRETYYNMLLKCTLTDDDGILYYGPNGSAYFAKPGWSKNEHMFLNIGGRVRELERTQSPGVWHDLNAGIIAESTQLYAQYNLKSAMNIESAIYITNDYQFAFHVGDTTEDEEITYDWRTSTEKTIRGLISLSDDNRDVVLYTNGAQDAIILRKSPSGDYIGLRPIMSEADLTPEVSYTNEVLGTIGGYTLSGSAYDEDSGVRYVFEPSQLCTKYLQDGTAMHYAYFINDDGYMSLSCIDGFGSTDYMYYDVEQNLIYRLVYERDSWYTYLNRVNELGSDYADLKSKVETVVVDNPNSRLFLGTTQISETVELLSSVPDAEAAMNQSNIEQLRTVLDSIAEDEASRLEYEAQVQYELDMFLEEARQAAEQRRQFQEASDQQLQEWVDNHSYPIYNPWYGQTSMPGYDPWGYWTYEPDPWELKQQELPDNPGLSVKECWEQYDQPFYPRFYIEMRCTCATCWNSTYPVDKMADNIAFVDTNVIAPSTDITWDLEKVWTVNAAYGLVTGQNILCYTSNHNAVMEWERQAKNVYMVVG